MVVAFRYPDSARRVRFVGRPNRYLAHVRPATGGGRAFAAHVPNPGRMEELLIPGVTTGWVIRAPGPHRSTAWDLVAVRWGRTTVSIDARIGNRIVGRAIAEGALDGFGSGRWRSEVSLGTERYDFARLTAHGRPSVLLEVKSSNLRVGETALFPDAPTARGARQVRALARWARTGVASYLLFVVQRGDCSSFRLNARLDPEFDAAVRGARAAGVAILARSLRVRPGAVEWGRPLPVEGSE